MRKWGKIILVFLVVLLLLLIVGPFLVPVPPLQGVSRARELADPDSQFVTLNEIDVHYKTAGQGEPVFLLLHGFGASLFSWREVIEPLGAAGRVVAFDRPAFGLTERPPDWGARNPYGMEGQVALTVELMDHLGIEQAILVGNSAGGTTSMMVALEHPQRVQALVLVDPAVYTGQPIPEWLRLIFATPQARRLGPLFVRNIQDWGPDVVRRAWHDPQKVTPEILEGYTRPLQVENWDKGLWELTIANRPLNLPERLDEISQPVLVITGDDDRIVPTEQSIRLAGQMPQAELVVIPNCGHVPQEECPAAFLDALLAFIEGLPSP